MEGKTPSVSLLFNAPPWTAPLSDKKEGPRIPPGAEVGRFEEEVGRADPPANPSLTEGRRERSARGAR